MSANFYFVKDENLVLRPLKDCNKQGQGRWKKAYQAVKHDRTESLVAGNVANLIRAMAALYVLNLYKKGDKHEEINAGDLFDMSRGSDIFSVKAFRATSLKMKSNMSDDDIISYANEDKEKSLNEAVFIDKYMDDSFIEMHSNYMKDLEVTKRNVENSVELTEYFSAHPEAKNQLLTISCIECGEEIERRKLGIKDTDNLDDETKERIRQAGLLMLRKTISSYYKQSGVPARRELVLNKLQQIYPDLSEKDV